MGREYAWRLVLLFFVLAAAACDPGVDVRIQNTTDEYVEIYSWSTRSSSVKYPDLKLGPQQEKVTSWLTSDPRNLRRRVEARDKDGNVLFCHIYTWKDRVSDELWEVVIIKGQNSCDTPGNTS